MTNTSNPRVRCMRCVWSSPRGEKKKKQLTASFHSRTHFPIQGIRLSTASSRTNLAVDAKSVSIILMVKDSACGRG